MDATISQARRKIFAVLQTTTHHESQGSYTEIIRGTLVYVTGQVKKIFLSEKYEQNSSTIFFFPFVRYEWLIKNLILNYMSSRTENTDKHDYCLWLGNK